MTDEQTNEQSVATLLKIIARKTKYLDWSLDQRGALQDRIADLSGIITSCHAFLGLEQGVGLRQGLDDLWESRTRLRKLARFGQKHNADCPPGYPCECGLDAATVAVAEHGDLEE